jgi:hypothetical protein
MVRKVRAGHLADGRHAPCIFPFSSLHPPKGEFPAIRLLNTAFSLSLYIPDVFIHFIHIDRVFHPTDLRKERGRESLYRRH